MREGFINIWRVQKPHPPFRHPPRSPRAPASPRPHLGAWLSSCPSHPTARPLTGGASSLSPRPCTGQCVGPVGFSRWCPRVRTGVHQVCWGCCPYAAVLGGPTAGWWLPCSLDGAPLPHASLSLCLAREPYPSQRPAGTQLSCLRDSLETTPHSSQALETQSRPHRTAINLTLDLSL